MNAEAGTIDRKALEAILNLAPPACELAVAVVDESSRTTRLAESVIQANVSVRDLTVWLELRRDTRSTLVTLHSLEPEPVKAAIGQALRILDTLGDGDPLIPLESAKPVPRIDMFDRKTDAWSPKQAAKALREAVRIADIGRLSVAGALTLTSTARGIAHTGGMMLTASRTEVDLSLTCADPSGASGWDRAYGHRIGDIDIAAVAKRAASRAIRSRDPVELEPGPYTVVLEPGAVGPMLLFLSFLSFGGSPFNRGTSFMAGHIGEKVLPDFMTIRDDPLDPRMGGWPFDFEGTPCAPVTLVENGVARAVVHDRTTAEISTGHALAPGNGFGPYPKCMVMSPGETSTDAWIAGIDQGLLITRFWYINYVNPMKTMITGTTRDGTFRIQNGKVTGAVRNMRFVESILEAFRRATAVSSEREYFRMFGSTMRIPSMVIPAFTFTEVAS